MQCYNASCAVPTVGVAASTFASAVQYFAATQCLITEGTYPDAKIRNLEKFDFIIVGAGSTGCVLANRLSEVRDWSVLLIEAGGDPPAEASIPSFRDVLTEGKYSWNYKTVPDGVTNWAHVNGSMHWPRGKMFGGSSNFNGFVYVRGNDHDYQKWYDTGNKEWSVEEVHRCFRKAENLQDMSLNKNQKVSKYYGHDGPLIINTFNDSFSELNDKILRSWNEIGVKTVLDLNVANVLGSALPRVTVSNGERNSVSKAYLQSIKNRKNLKILKNALVTKVLIDSTKKACGVIVKRYGKTIKICANKEVILSAGSTNSPQLLMLSGIGPEKHLTAKNISTIINSPMVGQNLTTHIGSPLFICTNETSTKSIADVHFQMFQYIHNRTGFYAENIGPTAIAFFALNKNAKYPDFVGNIGQIVKNTPNFKKKLLAENYEKSVADSIAELNKEYTLYRFQVSILHQYSTGNISLASNNPKDSPLIHPNFYKDPRDLELMASGVEKMLKLLNTTHFKSINSFVARINIPECNKLEVESREYYKCLSKNLIAGCHHAGTCRMGSDTNKSVVNSRLKVHGVDKLRVIDASVIPYTISGNINGPCVMIGERAADIIKQDYNM